MADFLDPYGGAPAPVQPDSTADSVVYDPNNPGWAEVSFSDGRKATLPADEAEALPKTPTATPPVDYSTGTFGPPPDAAPPPGAPNPLAQQWAAAGQDPMVQAAEAHTAPPGYVAPLGRPSNPAAPPVTGVPVRVGTGEAVPSPSEIVAPGSPGGVAPYSATTGESTTTTERAETPEEAQARTAGAYDAAATAARDVDVRNYQAKDQALAAQDRELAAQQAEAQRLAAQARNEKAVQDRYLQAMDQTPIDEDGFWGSSPGRKIGAWVMLALSGFLQGATRGQNPALNQMVQSLNQAQDRWIRTQQAQRESQYRRRERLMGDADATEKSYRMQVAGLVAKRIDLHAQRAGTPPPPGLETYKAQLGVKAAEAQNAIGQTVVRQATEQTQRELRATPATGPVTRFDAERRALGVDDKRHQEAMGPENDLGGKVRAAEDMKRISSALRTIADANGGQLPAQGTLSWRQLGLAPLAARLGVKNADEQVRTDQLLNQASLAYIASLRNIKGIDSNMEREKFERALNTGVPGSTIAAIDDRAAAAEQNAVSAASGFAGGNARRYIDLIRAQQNDDAGAPPARGFQPLGRTPGVPAAGGAAPGPLPTAAAHATGTYIRLKDRVKP